MQTLVEAASHIAQEIERTRQHLTNLEQALAGLKPLITVDAVTETLTFAMPSTAQPIEDLSVVNAEAPARKKAKPKLTIKAKVKNTQTGKPKVITPPPVVEPVKLPATGATLWIKCIGRKKSSVNQIVDAALKKLKLDDSARVAITNRATSWAIGAAKKGILVTVGTRDGYKLYQLAATKVAEKVQPVPIAKSVKSIESVEPVDVEPATEVGS